MSKGFFLLLFLASALMPAITLAADAKDNFKWYCTQCHGEAGKGDGINSVDELPVGPMDLTSAKEMGKFTAAMITKTLTHGGPVNTLDSLMPPWGDRLTSSEIKELVDYVQGLCTKTGCP